MVLLGGNVGQVGALFPQISRGNYCETFRKLYELIREFASHCTDFEQILRKYGCFSGHLAPHRSRLLSVLVCLF